MSSPTETPTSSSADPAARSVGELLGEITADVSTLMRQEVALAKAEITQSTKRASKGAGMLGGAGFAGYMVVLFLSIALWWGLGNSTGRGWAGLIVAVIWAVLGLILFLMGRSQLRAVRGLDRTTDTVAKIPNAMTGNEGTNR